MGRRDLAVFAGGVIGTLARAGIAEAAPPTAGTWPWHTFAANVLGALLLALLAGWAAHRWTVDDLRLVFLGTGLLGSFTTFSTFAVEVRLLGLTGLGLTYGVVSVAVGLAVVRGGLAVARPTPRRTA